MRDLVVGKTSYVSLAEADELLSESPRAAASWLALPVADRTAALLTAFRMLEAQRWAGTKAALLNLDEVEVAVDGTGYEVGDEVHAVGGTGTAAAFVVAELAANGAIATLTPLDAGLYSEAPSSPAALENSGSGIGLDATIAFETVTQQASWPRVGVLDQNGEPIDETTVPEDVERAQATLAYEITKNVELEAGGPANGAGLLSSVRAGSVGFTFFRPQGSAASDRFPPSVTELIAHLFSSGPTDVAGAEATGTDEESEFAEQKFELDGPVS